MVPTSVAWRGLFRMDWCFRAGMEEKLSFEWERECGTIVRVLLQAHGFCVPLRCSGSATLNGLDTGVL